MLIAMLALVLNGPGTGAGAGQPPSCTGMACTVESQAQASASPCAAGSHRCHPSRSTPVPVATTPRSATLEPTLAGPDPEPAPWPTQHVRWQPDAMPVRAHGGPSLASLPGTFPGILERTCVLRI
jgi:hypothetical protein